MKGLVALWRETLIAKNVMNYPAPEHQSIFGSILPEIDQKRISLE
jgi:hypothetical protein